MRRSSHDKTRPFVVRVLQSAYDFEPDIAEINGDTYKHTGKYKWEVLKVPPFKGAARNRRYTLINSNRPVFDVCSTVSFSEDRTPDHRT